MAQNKATDPYVHQKKYNSTMEGAGMRRTTVWVPEGEVENIINMAASMRDQSKRANAAKR